MTEAFRRGAHVLIVRNRVRRRLAAIRHKLTLVGGASANAVEAILSAESAPAPAQVSQEPHRTPPPPSY